MSNDLVAMARELCEAYIKEIKIEIRYHDYQIGANIDSIRLGLRQSLNSWLTHKAEFDEHKNYKGLCDSCDNGVGGVLYSCDFIVTKAKRLLGE